MNWNSFIPMIIVCNNLDDQAMSKLLMKSTHHKIVLVAHKIVHVAHKSFCYSFIIWLKTYYFSRKFHCNSGKILWKRERFVALLGWRGSLCMWVVIIIITIIFIIIDIIINNITIIITTFILLMFFFIKLWQIIRLASLQTQNFSGNSLPVIRFYGDDGDGDGVNDDGVGDSVDDESDHRCCCCCCSFCRSVPQKFLRSFFMVR